MQEPLKGLFTSSKVLTLDFKNISVSMPGYANMQKYFEDCIQHDIDPKKPENRQRFHNQLLEELDVRYLVGQYAEDRIAMLANSEIAKESRTLHLGIDIFCTDQESVYAPCSGNIVRLGQEPEDHSFGYYLFFKPDKPDMPYMLFGHLAKHSGQIRHVEAGDIIGKLGDYTNNENGGWSRHLHLQMFRNIPGTDESLIGYASYETLDSARELYPDPLAFFPEWIIESL